MGPPNRTTKKVNLVYVGSLDVVGDPDLLSYKGIRVEPTVVFTVGAARNIPEYTCRSVPGLGSYKRKSEVRGSKVALPTDGRWLGSRSRSGDIAPLNH